MLLTTNWIGCADDTDDGGPPSEYFQSANHYGTREVLPFCNETVHSCHADCHCGDGVCEPTLGENAVTCEFDCFCGDGACDAAYENWYNCSMDCAPVCGNGICECTKDGQWGGAVCCFDDYYGDASGPLGEGDPHAYQSDHADYRAPDYDYSLRGCAPDTTTWSAMGAAYFNATGPETQESCPFDCGLPCPPFCDVAVCVDGSRLYDTSATAYEVQHRKVIDGGGGGGGGGGGDGKGAGGGGGGGGGGSGGWTTGTVTGDVTTYKMKQLDPDSTYEIRARAANRAGFGGWSETLTMTTLGAVTAGQCIQDDAPCSDRNGEVKGLHTRARPPPHSKQPTRNPAAQLLQIYSSTTHAPSQTTHTAAAAPSPSASALATAASPSPSTPSMPTHPQPCRTTFDHLRSGDGDQLPLRWRWVHVGARSGAAGGKLLLGL